MARAIWSGAISFGLVNIPVTLQSAKESKRISFHMLDRRDNSQIAYKKVSRKSGKEVPAKEIVKGYEYEKGQFVIIQEADFKRANPKATQTVDIEDFIETEQIDILMYEKPYYLVPEKTGRKGYVLLRKVLEQTGKAAVARIVMHGREHLVAVIPRGDYLILETLRYAHEVREVEDAHFLDEANLNEIRINSKELQMAQALVKDMTSSWKPEKYKDTYQDDLLKFIKKKIKNGDTEESESDSEVEVATEKNVVDLMPLLKKSLAAAAGQGAKAPRKRTKAASHRGAEA